MLYHKEMNEKEKEEIIKFMYRQIGIEGQLVSLYIETSGEVESSAVRHLLHMIQLDSMKHIDICQLVIDILKGEKILKKEKEELLVGLQRHINLEKESRDMAKKILNINLIQTTAGLKELVEKWRKDEEEHHNTMRNLTNKNFFEVPFDFTSAIKSPEALEATYKKLKKIK